MSQEAIEDPKFPPVGSIDNPGVADDVLICKPERFLIQRIGFEDRQDAYIISFIDRDMVIKNDPVRLAGEYKVRATLEVTETFFKDLLRVGLEQMDIKTITAAKDSEKTEQDAP